MKKHITYGYIVMPDNDKSASVDQINAIAEYSPDCVFTDRKYNAKTDRTSLKHILRMLKPDDVLVTPKLSSLGRNYAEILKHWNRIMEKSAFIVILEHPVVDTRPGKQGSEKTAAEFLSFIMEMEKATKLRKLTPGRPRKKIPSEFYDIKERWQEHEISARKASKRLGIAHNTFLRWVREY